MRKLGIIVLALSAIMCVLPLYVSASECGPKVCLPDPPIPPETMGPVSLPFDVPVWPVLLKTEFHILPWVKMGKASICIPGTCKSVEIPAPCFSLKPIPLWIPWLRPLDAECKDCGPSWVP